MRIGSVRVDGLFGLFDHLIELHRDERITIIHGPNGFGKTIILRMVKALFDGQWDIFFRVPLRAFTVTMDDGHVVRLKVSRGNVDSQLELSGVGDRGEQEVSGFAAVANVELVVTSSRHEERFTLPLTDMFADMIGRRESSVELPDGRLLKRLGPNIWFDETGKILDLPALLKQYGSTLSEIRLSSGMRRAPGWLRDLCEHTHTRLIETQRLDVEEDDDPERPRRKRGIRRRPTVLSYSDELAGTVRNLLATYASRSQDLDRTFPTRLLEQSESAPAADELQDRLASLEDKRRHLTALGFLDPEESPGLPTSHAMEGKRDVLAVYVVDMQKKLAVFDGLAAKLELLLGIINDIFLYKQMRIDREKGFVFTSATGETIAADDLSSGEQHQLILLYELLFHTAPGSLVLIDEPEISLHVVWQERFLDDLMKLVKVSDFDVLVATHSPEIIGEYWDLVEELRGPDDRRERARRGAGA